MGVGWEYDEPEDVLNKLITKYKERITPISASTAKTDTTVLNFGLRYPYLTVCRKIKAQATKNTSKRMM